MQTATHGNGNGLDDLYILPDNELESSLIVAFLAAIQVKHSWKVSDTPGQDWYGRRFIEIPFGESWLEKIQAAVQV